MEPNLWLWTAWLGTPRENGVSLTLDKAPVDRSNILLIEERNMSLKFRSNRSCHILRTNSWAAVLKHALNRVIRRVRHVIRVEGNDIRVRQLVVVDLFECKAIVPNP